MATELASLATRSEERAVLEARLRYLEAASTMSQSRAERRQLRACQDALAWLNQRAEGEWATAWGPGGVARTFAIFMTLSTLASAAFAARRFTIAASIGWLLIVAFGVAGAALVAKVHWLANERAYHDQLRRARDHASAPGSGAYHSVPSPPN
jgi:hypothetical protein